jgi:hypothetical protein
MTPNVELCCCERGRAEKRSAFRRMDYFRYRSCIHIGRLAEGASLLTQPALQV